MKKYCTKCIYETLPYKEIKINKHDILFHEGEALQDVFHIAKGYVKVLKYYNTGDEKIFDMLGPGDFIGLLLVLQEKENYQVTVIALTDLVLRKITVQDTLTAYRKNTMFQKTCLSCAACRATTFQSQLYQVADTDMDQRIIGILIDLYKKFGTYKNQRHQLYLPLSQEDLANLIGIRRETLSRRLKHLRDIKMIETTKHMFYFHHI